MISDIILKLPEFSQFIGQYGAIGIFIWFISFDNLTPIPSEISLITIGYLTAHGIFNPVAAIAASFAGFLFVDLVYYQLTITGNKFIKKITGKTNHRFIEKYKDRMRKQMAKTLIVLIFIPRVRMFGPILVALCKLPFKKFLVVDSIGLVLFCTLFIALGMIFHQTLSKLEDDIGVASNIIFISAMLLLSVLIILFIRHKIKKEN